MALTPLFILRTLCKGTIAQTVVTQEPSLTVIPGGTVTMTCSSSTGAVTSGHYPYWFQQKSGQVPRLLMYDTNSRASGGPARFSGSLLGDKAALTITGAQTEDEAHYYCVLLYGGPGVFGGGTRLTVLGQPKATPTVNVFAPSQEELDTKKATLVCLLNGFYPSTVEVSWTKDGSPVSQGVNTATPSRQSDNKYSTSSFLSLSADQWLSANTYTCKVSHDGKVIQKELSRSQCT
nr:immunoglobulin lambda light chain variable region [Notamacropus eugenii]